MRGKKKKRDEGRKMGEGTEGQRDRDREGGQGWDQSRGDRGQRDTHRAKVTHETDMEGKRKHQSRRSAEEIILFSKTPFHSPQGPQPNHSLFPRRPISMSRAPAVPKCLLLLHGCVCPSLQTLSPCLCT